MKLNVSTVLILFVFSLFCGIMIISIGMGNEFTAINKVMGPLVCNGGVKLEAAWEYNVSHPGKAIYDSQWVCVDDPAATALDVSLKTNLVAGTTYGLLMFAVLLIIWAWVNRSGSK
jgi:hypothetical protein